MNPYRDPPPVGTYDPWSRVHRKPFLLLWSMCFGWFVIVGFLRWAEFGSPWQAFTMAVHWVPTLVPSYLFMRWWSRRYGRR